MLILLAPVVIEFIYVVVGVTGQWFMAKSTSVGRLAYAEIGVARWAKSLKKYPPVTVDIKLTLGRIYLLTTDRALDEWIIVNS